MISDEAHERLLSRQEIIEKYLSLDSDARFRDFAGKIEINQYGELLVNAANRLHVVVQKRLATYLEHHLGGEAMTEMPITVQTGDGATRLRVPDIVWSAEPGVFDGPPELKVLTQPPSLCIEVKSDGNTMKELREKRDELLAVGADEVWFVFPERRQVEFFGKDGKRAASQFGIDLTGFWGSY